VGFECISLPQRSGEKWSKDGKEERGGDNIQGDFFGGTRFGLKRGCPGLNQIGL